MSILRAAEGREGVLFIGGFEHTPNIGCRRPAGPRRDADRVAAVGRRAGDDRRRIGASGDPALASGQVEIAGWVPDVDPLFDRARAMVAPLTYGAGLKGKVTQSLAAGLPVVTTPIGAEGLDATDGEQMLIANDDEALAERVIRALSDDAAVAVVIGLRSGTGQSAVLARGDGGDARRDPHRRAATALRRVHPGRRAGGAAGTDQERLIQNEPPPRSLPPG